ncbi:MAG: hypothetical protein R3358_09330 [Woeseiaceae bacterium]|nr:hypothetical protein [Woeseiaceae bacterium]
MIASHQTVLRVIIFSAVLAGCGGNVRLDPPTIPAPNIHQEQITVAVRMPEHFDDFVHEENVLGREQWRIDLGNSNAVFFSQLFSYMFRDTIIVEPDGDPWQHSIDALIEPSIEAFEFSVPNQTKTDSFAVWIRYRIKVYDRYGTLVASAPISAYGKSLTTTMGGDEALQRAAVLAMRDAAALMIIKFEEQTLFKQLADPSTRLPAVADDSEG